MIRSPSSGRAALTSSNSEASLGSAATNCSQVRPCRPLLLTSCLITYRLCSIAHTALSPPASVFIPESDEVALGKCSVHKGVLDIADPGRNISKHKRSYLASPLHVASFLFLKRRFCVPGLSGASELEMVATVGRPGECWFPGDPPEEMNVSIVGAMPTSE